ncbi:MAG: 5-methylthioadenosine/S-adenosylhomocysteine deaminase [Cycloclasticus sp.]|jgi:5-methylthioadenosine/S-adenosylhomocysteine deaminase
MATINGAKALGLDHKIGSLEIGKQADILAIDLNTIEIQPVYDVMSSIVYSANRSQITDLWVAGKALMKNRKLTSLDEERLLSKAQQWHEKINPFHHQSFENGVK